ncbi:PAS domain-containing sensor histidine kinase [Spirosoma spitsbergense]|uniref:PAS domain-containing sensor histidine kinase n=1 Tax=Spirosoma spitsbergense TaxID=431554 RepID=UPI000371CF6B|nr:PAS domain S-box protein [Spirosoma spitsbergense]
MNGENRPIDQQMVAQTERLSFTLQATGIGTWELNPATQLIHWDQRCRELFGFTTGEDSVDYNQVLALVHPQDQPQVHQAIQQALDGKLNGQYEVLFRTQPDNQGQVRWLRSRGKVFVNDQGGFHRFLGMAEDITQAVQTRQQLEASEERFRMLIEMAPVAIGTLRGDDLIIETANSKALEIVGKPASIIGRPWLQAIPELAGQPAEAIIQEVYRTGVPYTVTEFPAQLEKNGKSETGYYTFSYLPLNENERTTGILQVAIDVTEPVMARKKLEDSEASLRSLIQEAPVATALFVGPELVIEIANELMIDFFGKGTSILGQPVREVLTASSDQTALQLLETVFATGEAYEATAAPADLTINGVPGRYYFDFSLKPLYKPDGQVYAILQMAIEVTMRVQARQEMEEAQAGLRGAIELAQLGTWSIDVATNGLTYSDRLIEWFGYDPGQQPYQAVIPLLQATDQERVSSAVAWALNPESDGIYDEIFTVIHPGTGQRRILHAQGKTIFDAAGKAVRMNGTAQDITNQRELQLALEHEVQLRTEELAAMNEKLTTNNEELEAINRLLNRSNANLQQFAYVASHDLQEPLRKIQQFGDLLKTRLADIRGEELTYIERMQSAASRMSTLIRDLLSFSRMSAEYDMRVGLSLNEVVNRVLTDLEVVIAETGAVVRVASLPTVWGDATQLGQLFQNILTNALKFRRAGVVPLIEVNADRLEAMAIPPSVKPARVANAYYRIDVADNGIGFDEKYLDRIFQVFQRLHGKSEFTGTGIGLAICERVVANHGGAITASSQPGQGATFSVYLPI